MSSSAIRRRRLIRVKVFNHLLGESGTTFFAGKLLARRLRTRFPRSLDGAPMLLPTLNTSMRRALEQWFEAEDVRPVVAGEFEDPALLNTFGERGDAVLRRQPPSKRKSCAVAGSRSSDELQSCGNGAHAISAERRLTHPAVAAITSAARTEIFKART